MNSKDVENKLLRKYKLRAHRAYIIVWIIIIGLLAAFGIPWLIGPIGFIFSKIPGWGDPNAASNIILDLDMLPSFLGGLVGILIGFVLEGVFFEQLRHLKKYEAYCVSLRGTFTSMLETCHRVKEENKLWEINKLLLEDVMTSVEKDALFYNLPRYLFFEVKFGKRKYNVKGVIHEKLHDINRILNAIQNEVYKYEKMSPGSNEEVQKKKELAAIYEELTNSICEFFMATEMTIPDVVSSKGNSTGE